MDRPAPNAAPVAVYASLYKALTVANTAEGRFKLETLFQQYGPLDAFWATRPWTGGQRPEPQPLAHLFLAAPNVRAKMGLAVRPQTQLWRQLKAWGVDLNAPTRDLPHESVLHTVARRCDVSAVKALLTAGADPHVVNAFGVVPLASIPSHSWSREAYQTRLAFVKKTTRAAQLILPDGTSLLSVWMPSSDRPNVCALLAQMARPELLPAWVQIDPATGKTPIDALAQAIERSPLHRHFATPWFTAWAAQVQRHRLDEGTSKPTSLPARGMRL